MQSLLRWGIENSSNEDSSAAPSASTQRMTDLDPGVIDAILGRPDSELMKEALARAQDASLDEDARLTALDDLEMVRPSCMTRLPPHATHSLPYASARREHRQCKRCVCVRALHACGEHHSQHILIPDLEKLGMWAPLRGLLGSPSDEVQVQALWVIGTAVQNNPSAQRAVRLPTALISFILTADTHARVAQYLALDPFPTLLAFLAPASRAPAQLRSKAIYALSGLLKHHAAALAPFDAGGGWVALRGALSGTAPPLQRFYFFSNAHTHAHAKRLGHWRAAQNRLFAQYAPAADDTRGQL